MEIYIKNITSFIKKDILKHMKSKINYIEITIPNYFTTDSRWNDFESKKKIVRCIRKGLSKIDQSYVDNYDFKAFNDNLVVKSKNSKPKSLEDIMNEFVDIVINSKSNLVKVTPTLLRNPEKFILFFNKVIKIKNQDFKNNHKFLLKDDYLKIISKKELNDECTNFVDEILKELTLILDNESEYKEFKEKIFIIPENLTTIYNLNKLFLKILNDKDKIIKHKFRFEFNEDKVIISLNYCLKLFCKGAEDKCYRCHHHHTYGKFCQFFNYLNCYKINNNNCYIERVVEKYETYIDNNLLKFENNDDKARYEKEKENQLLEKEYDIEFIKNKENDAIIDYPIYFNYSLIYESYIDESLLEFNDKNDYDYYISQRDLRNDGKEYDKEYLDNILKSITVFNIRNDNYYFDTLFKINMNDSIYDYCFEITEEKLELKKKSIISQYEEENKVFNEDLYFQTDSLEKLIIDYIDNPDVIINLITNDGERCLKIQFNNWYKFKNNLKYNFVKSEKHFPYLSPKSSTQSVSSSDSIWFKKNKKLQSESNYIKKDNKWIKKENSDLDEELLKIQSLEVKNNKKVLRNLESPSTISTKSAFSPRPYLISPTPSTNIKKKMFTNKHKDYESDDDEYNDYSDEYYQNYHNKKFLSINGTNDLEYNDNEEEEDYENFEYDEYEN